MRELPRGWVTFLMTDVQDSMVKWEARAEVMKLATRHHDDLAEEIVEEFGGHLLKKKGAGDALFIVFENPLSAVECAVALQRAFENADWPQDEKLLVRMGIHVGKPMDYRDDDYFGPVVNRCARIQGAGHGGQILVSQEVADACNVRQIDPSISFKDLGEHRLKSLELPLRLFQVEAPGLRNEFLPLQTLNPKRTNLPFQSAPLVGREEELIKIQRTMEMRRFVCLTGTGGVGKTRLAIQAGAEMMSRFDDGVWLVSLDNWNPSRSLEDTIAEQLDLTESINAGLAQQLRGKGLLLILDTCDRLLDQVAGLSHELLLKCPGLTIMATAREPIRVPDGVTLEVPLLTAPDPGASAGALIHNPAVQIFLQRAWDADAPIDTSADSLQIIGRICKELEGIPFLLELAAQLARAIPLRDLLPRLKDRLRLFSRKDPTRGSKQLNVEALLDWSFENLSHPAQVLLCRCSIFHCAWSLAEGEGIAANQSPLTPDDALALMAELVDKHLVQLNPVLGRYQMLNLTREYCERKWPDFLGDQDAVGITARLAAFYEDRSEHFAQAHGAEKFAALTELTLSLENVRLALNHLEETDLVRHCTMSLNLMDAYLAKARYAEARTQLEKSLRATENPRPDLFQRALQVAGNYARLQGDYAAAMSYYQEVLEVGIAKGDEILAATSHTNLATCALYARDTRLARHHVEAALPHSEGHLRASLEIIRINIHQLENDFAQAESVAHDAIAYCKAQGLDYLLPYININLSLILVKQGRPSEALDILRPLLSDARILDQKQILIDALRFAVLALVALQQWEPAGAIYAIERHVCRELKIALAPEDQLDYDAAASELEITGVIPQEVLANREIDELLGEAIQKLVNEPARIP